MKSVTFENQNNSQKSIKNADPGKSSLKKEADFGRTSPVSVTPNAWGQVPIKYRVLKQGEPYKALASNLTTNLLSKADYGQLKEEEIELG